MIETRPVHEQLLDLYHRRLAEREWAVGGRFPSEREMAQEHGVSRATANKVLAKLVSEGHLELRKGLGAFVAQRPTLFASLQRLQSFTEFARNHGYKPETEVVSFEISDQAPHGISERHSLGKTRWIYIERLRRADGVLVIFEKRWLPECLYQGLQSSDLEGSFYELSQVRYKAITAKQDTVISVSLSS